MFLKTLPLSFFLFIQGTLNAQILRYTIDVLPRTAKEMRVSVDLELYHSDRDTIYLSIPVRINQVENLFQHYQNWSVEGGRVVKKDSTRITIKRTESVKPTIKVHYDIFQPSAGDAVTRTNSSGPLIQPDYVHIRGYSLFLVPNHYKTYEVEVNWRKIPKQWKIQNSFSFDAKKQYFKSVNRDDWRRTNWVAGVFRQYKSEVFGKPVCFALRGNWNFDDTTLFNTILKIVKTQRQQWDDRDIDFYSVTLIPYKIPDKASDWDKESLCMGNGLYQSFVTYADESSLLNDFIDLFNHEMMHEWIGGRINEGIPKEGINMRWFVEGFTEYFALRNRWKAGFMTEKAFFEELNNEYLANYYNSPFAQLPNIEAENRRWESFELDRLAYRRGCVAAVYFDCAIRQRSGNKKTLFDTMNELMEYTYGSKRDLTNSYDFFTETLGNDYGQDPTIWLNHHIDRGETIPASSFILPKYLLLTTLPNGVPQINLHPAVDNAAALYLKD